MDDNLKRYIKNPSFVYLNILAIGQQYLSICPPSFFNIATVDYAGLYINWANASLFIIPGTLPTLKLPRKTHPSSR